MENDLLTELAKERKSIKTDSYEMSIGELISLYHDGDLKLNPAYQRIYRWDQEHKVRFIESILIGIPIPQIFVAQKEDGKWDIVDGVQRISTLLQFVGNLPGYEPLVLDGTKYLPSLQGMTWETMPSDAKRIFKRTRIGINIVLTENNVESQYELFQRLNTGSVTLESQEIRNCLIIMLNERYYDQINELKKYPPFLHCINITADKINVEYHMELIVRYLIARRNKVDYQKYNPATEKLSHFLDKEIAYLIADNDFHLDVEIELFKRTFDYLDQKMGSKVFKKYDPEKEKFVGPFLNSSYEAILIGVAENLDYWEGKEIESRIKNMYTDPGYLEYAERGTRVVNRFKGLSDFSRRYFASAD